MISTDTIDAWLAAPAESENLEFKEAVNGYNSKKVMEYCVALANVGGGQLVLGISDKPPRRVVGTRAFSSAEKLNELKLRISDGLGIHVQVDEGQHSAKRVLAFTVPSRPDGWPLHIKGAYLYRVGESVVGMPPDVLKPILREGEQDWSAEICEHATLADLSADAIAKAREQFAVKNPQQADESQEWDDSVFLNKAKILKRGAVTNAALLLLGRPESAALIAPAVAKISWILKDADNRELHYAHIHPPFLLAGDALLARIRNILVRALPSGTLFPREIEKYDPWVIRETLHNCIAHQDYRLKGRVAVVEFPDHVLLQNVGSFLPGSVELVIQQDAPQLIYRNPFLAEAMVGLNMIDTQGGGIKRMFRTQRERSFPLPEYDLTKFSQVSVQIIGKILDERYTGMLMQRADLGLGQVMLLDRVQKRHRITHAEHRELKAAGLVEGRYPNLVVAATVAKATGHAGRHIRDRGFDKQYYLDLILELVRAHGPVGRADIERAVLPKLPDSVSRAQKKIKVGNLIQELRATEKIVNHGGRKWPAWVLAG